MAQAKGDDGSKKSPFDQAVEFVRNLPEENENNKMTSETKLKFYGLYKCATVGTCKDKGGTQPYKIQFEARAKWDAWNALGDLKPDDAKKQYVELLLKTTEKNQGKDKFVVAK